MPSAVDRTSWTEPPGCYGLWGLVREPAKGRVSAELDDAMGIVFNALLRRALQQGCGDLACVVGVLCMSGSKRPQGITDSKGRPNGDKSNGVRIRAAGASTSGPMRYGRDCRERPPQRNSQNAAGVLGAQPQSPVPVPSPSRCRVPSRCRFPSLLSARGTTRATRHRRGSPSTDAGGTPALPVAPGRREESTRVRPGR